MLKWVLKPLAWMPLAWLHALGCALGRIVYRTSRRYSARLDENLRQSGLASTDVEFDRLRRAAAGEAGKAVLELLAIWSSPPERLAGWISRVDNEDAIEVARRSGKGVLLLTPHLGCFEIAGFHFGQTLPITILYRPPRLRWLEPLMIAGRARGRTELATTDLKGVRRLLKALRKGDAVGLLPDQAPRFGEGVWAPFFGRPAFTMTLCNRLQRATGCATFMVFAERLSGGRGFHLHVDPLGGAFATEADLNAAVERMVRRRPEQYLWGYDRYKVPRGAAPAPAVDATAPASAPDEARP
jgi:KDO2-lipid IV(A) lauroyltransferase